jgi:hypothetical protein
MLRYPDDPDWAWDDNPERTALDYELMAEVDRWDGYGDPDPCDNPDYDEDEAAERLAFPVFQELSTPPPNPDIPF